MIFFLFLSHLGLGIVLTLPLVSRDAGVKFFRFNAGMAAILNIVGFAFLPDDYTGAAAEISLVALAIAEAAIVLYWATIGRMLASIRPAIVGTACIAGVIAIVMQALAVPSPWGAAGQALTVTSFLTSAAFLGGACTAMVLGHWYLVIPSMAVRHLQSIVKLHIGSMIVRVAIVGLAVGVAMAAWPPEMGPRFDRYIFSVDGIFFWQRILFGLAGPAVLSYLTWETARIQSTQSATGILYVDFFTVVVGEVLAKYLLLATRVPV